MLSEHQIQHLVIPSPKRTTQRSIGWQGFFPYYAGYPDAFADALIGQAAVKEDCLVFDPWNGSGTSTFSASKLGHRAIGFDINPVMALVAKARLLPMSEVPSLTPLVTQITEVAAADELTLGSDEPLLNWFGPKTACNFRKFERSVAKHLIPKTNVTSIESVSSIAACFYVALFTAAKKLARPLRASNPTWTRAANNGGRRLSIGFDQLRREFGQIIDAMETSMKRFAVQPIAVGPTISIKDSSKKYDATFQSDLILTSPPYCTRLDYTAATRIELAILNKLFFINTDELSRGMLGTVKVPRTAPDQNPSWGATANGFLSAMKDHPSKASSTYYLKNHLDYFDKLYRSLSLAMQAVKPGGIAVMVAQDSHYKNLHNDLPTVIVEMVTNQNAALVRREGFEAKRLMSGVHKYASKYRSTNKATEQVLIFQKAG